MKALKSTYKIQLRTLKLFQKKYFQAPSEDEEESKKKNLNFAVLLAGCGRFDGR